MTFSETQAGCVIMRHQLSIHVHRDSATKSMTNKWPKENFILFCMKSLNIKHKQINETSKFSINTVERSTDLGDSHRLNHLLSLSLALSLSHNCIMHYYQQLKTALQNLK